MVSAQNLEQNGESGCNPAGAKALNHLPQHVHSLPGKVTCFKSGFIGRISTQS
jgi:hypothetical protein